MLSVILLVLTTLLGAAIGHWTCGAPIGALIGFCVGILIRFGAGDEVMDFATDD